MIYKIELNIINNKSDDFNTATKKFLTKISDDMSKLSSLKNTCLKNQIDNLESQTDRLKTGYQNCNEWLKEYLDNIIKLENELESFNNSSLNPPLIFNGKFYDLFGERILPILKKEKASDYNKEYALLGSSNTSPEIETMIQKAEKTLGSGYTYHGYNWTGDPSTSVITCSGLVDYALDRPSRTDSPETLRDEIGRENITTDVSKLKRGDLVFYQFYGEGHTDGWGHVGIYLGDNKIIHSIPNGGVQYGTIDSGGVFLGGGTLLD